MTTRLDTLRLGSIHEINALAPERRDGIYARLVPPEVFARFAIDPATLRGDRGERLVRITAPAEEPWVRVEVRAASDDRDPALLVHVEMTPLTIPELAFVQINDPAGPRFAIDRDPDGQDTLFGTLTRNLAEEARALAAGLAPGQVRRGLRLLPRVLTAMDEFCRRLNQDFYLIEPLFYHSAILYERAGCGYLMGREHMGEIHEGFAPDGALTARLDGSTPFRQQGFERHARGRSWAIADGVLGAPYSGVKMYKAPGRSANVSTFPTGPY